MVYTSGQKKSYIISVIAIVIGLIIILYIYIVFEILCLNVYIRTYASRGSSSVIIVSGQLCDVSVSL